MSRRPVRIPLAQHAIDRDAAARSLPDAVATLRAEPGSRFLPLWRGRALLDERVDGSAAALSLLPVDRWIDGAHALYLGRIQGSPVFALILDDDSAHALEPEEARWQGLRAAAMTLGDADAALVAEAVALANWHETHQHCAVCGAVTELSQSGWTRVCPVDGKEHFPRTDPAVIVLVTDESDRVLLGSNASWQPGRYSLLAGFVEPGESLEQAVVRELAEETGLVVVDPVYAGSQPWPFPASIMLGFRARLAPGQGDEAIRPDGEEILDVRFFSRDDLRAGDIVLPGAASIARALLEDWFGEPLPDGPVRW